MERDIARRLGGKRHPADQGGGEDIEHPELCLQVKSGLAVVNQILRDGMASAKACANGKLPAVALVDRSRGRLARYLVFDLDQWADWYGYSSGLQEECTDGNED
jgi:hypothetical protein